MISKIAIGVISCHSDAVEMNTNESFKNSETNLKKENLDNSVISSKKLPSNLILVVDKDLEKIVEELKDYGKGLKIIIISNNGDQKTKKKTNYLGAVQFFRKPVDGYELIDVINWALKK